MATLALHSSSQYLGSMSWVVRRFLQRHCVCLRDGQDDGSLRHLTVPEQPNRLGVNVPILLVEGHLKVGETESDQEVLSSEL